MKTDAATIIFAALKDVLLTCIWPVNSCRGQAYDGTSVMSGHLHGVASRFKEEEPAARSCSLVRDSLELVMEVVKLINIHTLLKRTTLFNTTKSQLSPETQNLKPLCPTRWMVHTVAIKVILDNYETLLSTFGRDYYNWS